MAIRARVVPVLLVAVALSLLFLAVSFPVEHTESGGRTLEGWGLGMCAVALLAVAVTSMGAWRAAGLWSALFIVGSAAQLLLTRPHWAMSLRVARGALERPEHYAAVTVLLIQALVVGLAVIPRLGALIRLMGPRLNPLRLAILGVLFLFSAANVAVEYPAVFEFGYQTEIYVRRVLAAAAFFAINVANLWMIGLALPAGVLLELRGRVTAVLSMPGDMGSERQFDRSVPWVLAGVTLAMTLLATFLVFDAAPHIVDEMAYLMMAEVLAQGRLAVTAPPVPESFQLFTVVVRDGMRYGVAYPGWPLALAPAAALGVPWLLNPVVGAVSVVVGHALVRRAFDRGTAHVVALFLASSPWFLILSSVYQPHAISLLATLGTWLAVQVAREDGGAWPVLAAGLSAGVVFTVRPMDGVIVGASGLLYLVLPLEVGRNRWRALPVYVLGCVVTGSVALMVNKALTGNPLSFPIMEYLDGLWGPGANRLGFGAEVGRVWGVLDPIPGHGWRDVLLSLNQNFFILNYDLMGWATGSLALVAAHVLWGKWSRMDVFWAGFFVFALAMYSLYWANGGPDYGPRYWYSTILPLMILSTRGLLTLARTIETSVPERQIRPRLGVLTVLLLSCGVFLFGSWRAVSKYVGYRDYIPGLEELHESGVFGTDGLVFVEADGDAAYAALPLNDIVPGREGSVVYARDLGAETNARLVAALPDRSAFHLSARFKPDGWELTVSEYTR